ncbi:MAG TPA: nickel-type superoxide dismutase maturation protease [Candidatus Polarisedimenticolaceae bacterium]|nr:nickel-type superoxide dismutase maturation protease [Candidatus Polarisedimenticolaceae bacterium]
MIAAGRANLPLLACVLAVLATATWLATIWLGRPAVVAGRSMEPSLRDGDRVIVDLWTYDRRPPRVGEVVLISAPETDGAWIVKRVARRGARGELWLLGDNPRSSLDSRQWGWLPADRVVGRVVFRYWPPSRFGVAGRGSMATGFRLPGR